LISELSGHVDCVLKVQFTPDDRYISSASEDNSVRVWDVSTAEQIWKYESDCYFLSCGISPDGKYLAASSRDETIKIWELNKIIPNR
jgi:WD40 repeat protein